jgi:hypothetical protein
MSSIKKTPKHSDPACSLPEAAAAVAAEDAEVAEAAEAAGAAAALGDVQAAEAAESGGEGEAVACRGELAATARLRAPCLSAANEIRPSVASFAVDRALLPALSTDHRGGARDRSAKVGTPSALLRTRR